MTARARHADPETSHEAAATVNTRAHERIVLEIFRKHGPLTDQELGQIAERRYGIVGSSPRSRRADLTRKGYFAHTDYYTPPTGRRQRIWSMTITGLDALENLQEQK